ncbi:hypothetical protein SAPIO_CDS3949 [Scedosporium apiospermum]|uniref:Uncharacterized protein n=1 Tax=Pseudallescheria apiosperma TaxID=563466 RepID=A0A084G8Y8_PSEDA|nr:uncharacterized protein SAPIO_CDS3949 [Scedosporium apiospermum]KEZ43800.1 hypothetical protein SAPIO_CDS3949 [Scedosporium apiospermum]
MGSWKPRLAMSKFIKGRPYFASLDVKKASPAAGTCAQTLCRAAEIPPRTIPHFPGSIRPTLNDMQLHKELIDNIREKGRMFIPLSAIGAEYDIEFDPPGMPDLLYSQEQKLREGEYPDHGFILVYREVGKLEYYLSVLVVGLLHSPPLLCSPMGKRDLVEFVPALPFTLDHGDLPNDFTYAEETRLVHQPGAIEVDDWINKKFGLKPPAGKVLPLFVHSEGSICETDATHSRFNKAQNVFGCKATLVVPRDPDDFYNKPNNQV